MFAPNHSIQPPKKFKYNTSKTADEPVQNNGSFAIVSKKHHVHTVIYHWQLRNLIACSNKHIIFHPKHNSIFQYDTQTGTDTEYINEMGFTPATMDLRHGFIAAGGPRGIMLVKNIQTGFSKSWNAAHGMNNCVCVSLSPKESKPRVTVCNNDQTVSVFSIPGMEKIFSIKTPSAINHCSISPNNQKMVLVSDKGIAYVYEITENDYKQISEYKVSDEPSLSCAWNQSSEIFAVASQDGHVHVYDSVVKQKLCQLSSLETRRTKKAARSIQFSTGPLDLLVYAEHVSNIYIVDTRTFKKRQVIRLSPENEDHAITGLTFSPDAKVLYVGLEDRMVEIDINTSERRQFAGGQLMF
ncbi:WD40 repeat-like protein [Backusella circina FSU 941]|nr:WD40 repeat-like protein [Backusella circina FSU 941]